MTCGSEEPNAIVQIGNDPSLTDPNVRATEIELYDCLLYTSPSPRDGLLSRMPSSA